MAYWLERLNRLPPNVCRLLAREPHRAKVPLTTEQIAKRSGLSKQTVLKISKLRSWASVTLQNLERFEFGCGIRPGSEARQLWYLKRTKDKSKTQQGFYHLRRLMKQKKDTRLEKFYVDLMLPKE